MRGRLALTRCFRFETTYAVGMGHPRFVKDFIIFETTYAVGMKRENSSAEMPTFETTYAVGMLELHNLEMEVYIRNDLCGRDVARQVPGVAIGIRNDLCGRDASSLAKT